MVRNWVLESAGVEPAVGRGHTGPMTRAAAAEDVDQICAALPQTWFGTSWADVPTWLVRQRDGDTKGRGFVLYRKPHKTALDPATGEPFEDLLVVRTPSFEDKAALVQTGPWFDIEHFRRNSAVLVQLSRLDEVTRDELVEVITDAWRSCAPRRLVEEFDA